jgi:2-polyprenyl-3-methyl-5-hydroxy-6-metoxy-1,4-benzoquinol methylase
MYPSLAPVFFSLLLLLQIFIIRNQLSLESRYSTNRVPQEIDKFHNQLYFASSRAIPSGKVQNLPSIRIDDRNRPSNYGGQGDKPHLGGFVQLDIHGLSPGTWTYMLQTIGVKSIIDVGCGRGISSTWFIMHGVDTLCVEGSHDAFEKTMIPNPEKYIVEHDYSRGPWWPSKTYDAIWCVEFLEHVSHAIYSKATTTTS